MLTYIAQGLVQGLSEFLPVSSSGHLALMQHFFNFEDPDANLLTTVALHFGTLLAVLYYFRADILPYFTPSGWKNPDRRKIAMLVVAGSVPTALIGLGFKKHFESLFANPSAVCIALFITGLLLLICEKLKKQDNQQNLESISWWKAVSIGLVQGLAVTPGISRSGSTIATGLLLGIKGEDATRFSFLLMIPAVGGATLLKVKDLFETGLPESIEPAGLAAGTLVSVITGFLALKLLVYMVKQQKLSYFAYYLFCVSTISLILIQFAGK
ncbi:MAG: Undecaprenyl-diphosphatase [Candidatus Rifleibacterium amylolyticum]|nr:MAG: Undecaprenyl-diphosphatase [Candidatus Rifleibacterium amylolyticum]NLF97258.1 undecaprenyl-diphosphate phosphatase [Candidatus Riflebacteria bacterium]